MKLSQAEYLSNNLATMLEIKGIVGFKIAYNLRKLNQELNEYRKTKEEIFRKYGSEKDGVISVNRFSDNYVKFEEEINELQNQEVEITLKMISEDELAKCEELNGKQQMFLMENFYDSVDNT